jgi:hypothetical protein
VTRSDVLTAVSVLVLAGALYAAMRQVAPGPRPQGVKADVPPGPPAAQAADPGPPPFDRVCDAMYALENQGHRDRANLFQIGRLYYQDAAMYLQTAWKIECPDYPTAIASDYWSRELIRAYVARWAGAESDRVHPATIARLHRGGPEGPRRDWTRTYADNVCRLLRSWGYRV